MSVRWVGESDGVIICRPIIWLSATAYFYTLILNFLCIVGIAERTEDQTVTFTLHINPVALHFCDRLYVSRCMDTIEPFMVCCLGHRQKGSLVTH